jgi:hypothetical protein
MGEAQIFLGNYNVMYGGFLGNFWSVATWIPKRRGQTSEENS